jgi:isopenicillin-N epimerase
MLSVVPSLPRRPSWVGDHDAVRDLWQLDPAVTYLNHGAWGATPRAALAEQSRLRAEMEADPVDFLLHTVDARLAAARVPVAELLHADPDDLVFLPNTTTGVQTVLSSLPWRRGDRVVTTDHAYPAIAHQLDDVAARHGVEVAAVPIPLPPPAQDEIATAVLDAVDAAPTALVLIDAIVSQTALRLPVDEVVAGCRERGVPVLVDAAHAAGQLDVDLTALGADWWVSNLHKWCCAPKGTAVMHVRRDRQAALRPLVRSHGDTFRAAFDWTGTSDYSGWLAAPAAIEVLATLGWDRLHSYQHALAAYGASVVAAAVRTEPVLPADAHAAMTLVDPGRDLTWDQGEALHLRLYREHRIQVPLTWWGGRAWIRLSAQAYNRPDDYEHLADVIGDVL